MHICARRRLSIDGRKAEKSKGPNTHSVWWCYIVAILLILIYLLPIYIMLNLSLQDAAGSGHQAVPAGRLEFWKLC